MEAPILAASTAGSLIVADTEVVQPLASVMVTAHAPAGSDVTVGVVCPLHHKYVYAGTPSVTKTEAVPLVPPKHDTSVVAEMVAVTIPPSKMVNGVITWQPFESVTVTS